MNRPGVELRVQRLEAPMPGRETVDFLEFWRRHVGPDDEDLRDVYKGGELDHNSEKD